MARMAAPAKNITGYQRPARSLPKAPLSHVTISGSMPPIHPAAKLCGSVAALFLDFTGNNSARKAVCGPTTSASARDSAINISRIANGYS